MKVASIKNQFKESKSNHQSGFNESTILKSDSFSKLLSSESSADTFIKGSENAAILNEESNFEIEAYLKAKREFQEMQAQQNQIDREMQASKSQLESVQKTFDILLKCIKISSRIINGDNVPAKDHQLLLENYPKLYSVAMSARQEKDNPENHKSVVSKEEEMQEAVKVMSDEISKVLESIANTPSFSESDIS